ncbi:tRNA/rRNA cytosine-C5-methylase [Algoriphagus sp. Y33]|uniref:methyltransferase RsmF C-terminal domain-like protein n=1 Tax=Algoriphagus sp. Y33 TaxID=2772483 RepID=UPI00177C01A2|nr:tRNA/rRNA cytosine-C5-methylase [Algoriphagus sp. Y33]
MPETNLPIDFESQMLELLGKAEFEQFRKAINNPSRTSIRVNPSKNFSLSWANTQIFWSRNGFFLNDRPSFTLDPAIHAGAYYVQEASSMFIEHILYSLDVPKGIYLDIAAAPGGKTTLLSSYLGNEGTLIANEVIQSRAQILKENVIKWGLGNTVVTNNDPEHFEALEGFFDLVLVDAPCSGEGMFRKDPQARDEWSIDNVQLCSARQKRIMDQAGALVKADGYLVYSTCTFNERENEDLIRFLTEEFSYEPVRIPFDASWNIRETSVDSDGKTFYGYRFFPHLVEGEGFFITVLKRSAEAYIQEPKRMKDFKHPYLKEVWNKESFDLDEELGFDGSGKYYTLNDSFFRISKDWNLHFQKASQHLSLKYFGVELGKKQKNDWIPTHEWAVSVLPKNNFPTHELSEAEAVEFLRKNDFEVGDLPSGWVLITCKKLPLGWIKNLGNRVNNYYPKEWRIRM